MPKPKPPRGKRKAVKPQPSQQRPSQRVTSRSSSQHSLRTSPQKTSHPISSSSSTPTSGSPRKVTRKKLSSTPKSLGSSPILSGRRGTTSTRTSQIVEPLENPLATSTPAVPDETPQASSAVGRRVDPNSTSGSSAYSPEGVLRSGTQRYGLRDLSNRKSLDTSRSRHHPMSTPGPSRQRRLSLNARTPALTPYRTPNVKSLFKEAKEDLDEVEKKKVHKPDQILMWKADLKELIKHTWKISYASTLNNFNFENKKILKQYEHTLLKRVKDVYASYKLHVKINYSSCLRFRPRDVDAVRIYISSLVPQDNREDDYMKVVYTAWLFRSTKKQSKNIRGSHWFPVIFFTGLTSLHNVVAGWLSASFGAYVSAPTLRPLDLMWMTGVFSGKPCSYASHNKLKRPTDRLVTMRYLIKPPKRLRQFSLNILNTRRHLLSLRYPLEDIQYLWSSIVDTSEQDVKQEDLNCYYESLENFVEKTTHLPKSLMQLYELSTPCFNLRATGHIKVPCIKSASTIILQLMDLHIQGLQLFQDQDDDDIDDSAFLREYESFNSSSGSLNSTNTDSP